MQCTALTALRDLVGGLPAALNTNLKDVESAVEELIKVRPHHHDPVEGHSSGKVNNYFVSFFGCGPGGLYLFGHDGRAGPGEGPV